MLIQYSVFDMFVINMDRMGNKDKIKEYNDMRIEKSEMPVWC